MIVVMQAGADRREVEGVAQTLTGFGYKLHPIYGTERAVLAGVGSPPADEASLVEQVESLPGVERAVLILKPYRFASREFRPERSAVTV